VLETNVKKRIILLVMFGITIFPISILQAGDSLASDERNCPACPSFGVQRLEKKKAPSFSLKGLDGNKIALKDLKGKPIIVTFWATWCSPCKEELPTLEKFVEGKREQLAIVTMAIDGENEKKVRRFVEENKISLVVLLDEKEQTARTYRIRMVPTTLLIDREGMMIGTITGQRDWSVPEAWSAVKELFALH
jgi:peroxiredoxin